MVLFFGDPLVGNPYFGWNAVLDRLVRRLEEQAVNNASGLIFASREIMRMTLERHRKTNLKTLVYPQAFLPDLYGNVKRASSAKDRVTITFAGTFYKKRQPSVLLEALGDLRKVNHELLDKARLVFVGDNGEKYGETVKTLGLQRYVEFVGKVSYLESLEIMRQSDVLLNIDAPASFSPFFPGKLADYFGCALPIWSLSPLGPAAKLVEQYGGVVTPPDDRFAIAKDLIECIRRTEARAWKLDHSVVQGLNSWNLCPQLKRFLWEVANAG